MGRAVTELAWDDIQGNILRGYGFGHARHLVFSVTEAGAARRWLADVVPEVTIGAPWRPHRPTVTLNLAFTHRGLAALGLPDDQLASFPADFQQGMAARAGEQLGDVGLDSPGLWEAEGPHDPVAHVLLMVHAGTASDVAQAGERQAATAERHGLLLVSTQELAALLPAGSRPSRSTWRVSEHFGFLDGISQPAVEGAVAPTQVRGNGTPLSRDRWRPIRPGEFVLGYPDEEEAEPPLPRPPALVRNGSYLVWRKLAQDVAGFRRLLLEAGERHDIDPRLVGAKMMGRHPDGSPLLAVGVTPDSGGSGGGTAALNDLRYEEDPLGGACPLGSHVRRANPRDGFGLKPELVSRHRLLRRGMPYGPALPEGVLEDDEVPRGLLFVAYCASISRQFEFVQREWMNDGNVLGVGHTADPVAGQGTAPRRFYFEVAGCPPVLLGDLPRLVRTMGGEYLFQPGLTGLRYLASLG